MKVPHDDTLATDSAGGRHHHRLSKTGLRSAEFAQVPTPLGPLRPARGGAALGVAGGGGHPGWIGAPVRGS